MGTARRLQNFAERIITQSKIMKNKNIFRIALVTAFILLPPLVAMQFTDEVAWNLFDFASAGTLLFGSTSDRIGVYPHKTLYKRNGSFLGILVERER